LLNTDSIDILLSYLTFCASPVNNVSVLDLRTGKTLIILYYKVIPTLASSLFGLIALWTPGANTF
jgi:hypothetical protein